MNNITLGSGRNFQGRTIIALRANRFRGGCDILF